MSKKVDEIRSISGNMMRLFEEIWQIKQNKKEDTLTKESITELCKKHDVSVEEVQNLAVETITLGKFKSFSDLQSNMLSDDDLDEVAGGKPSAKRSIATLLAAISGVGNFLGSSSVARAMKDDTTQQTIVGASPTTRVASPAEKSLYEKTTESVKKAAGKVARGLSDVASKETLYIQKKFGLNATNAAVTAGALDAVALVMGFKILGMAVTALTGNSSSTPAPNSNESAESLHGNWLMNFVQAVGKNEIQINVSNYSERKPITILIANTNNDSKAFLVELAYNESTGNSGVRTLKVLNAKENQNTAAITMTPDVYAKTFFGAKNVQLILDDKSSALKFKSVGDNSKNQDLTDANLNPQQALYVSEYIRVIKNSNTKANDESAKKITDLTKELEDTNANLETQKSTIASLNAKKADLDEELKAKNAELEEARSQSKEANETAARLGEEKASLENKITEQRKELAELRLKLSDVQEIDSGVLTAVSTLDADTQANNLATLAQQYTTLKTNLDTKTAVIKQLNAELANAKATADEARAKFDGINTEKTELEEKYAELEQKLNETTDALKEAQARADSINKEKAEPKNKCAALEQKLNDTETASAPDNVRVTSGEPAQPPGQAAPTSSSESSQPDEGAKIPTLPRVPAPQPPPPPPPPESPGGKPTVKPSAGGLLAAINFDAARAGLKKTPEQPTISKDESPVDPKESLKDESSVDPQESFKNELTKAVVMRKGSRQTSNNTEQQSDSAEKIHKPNELFELCNQYSNGIPKDKLEETINKLSTEKWGPFSDVVAKMAQFLTNIRNGENVTNTSIKKDITVTAVEKSLERCNERTIDADKLTNSIINMIKTTCDRLKPTSAASVARRTESSGVEDTTTTGTTAVQLRKTEGAKRGTAPDTVTKINTLDDFLKLCKQHQEGINSAKELDEVIDTLRGINDSSLKILVSNVCEQLVLIQNGKDVPKANWNVLLMTFTNKAYVENLIKNMISKTCEKPFAQNLRTSSPTDKKPGPKKKNNGSGENTEPGEENVTTPPNFLSLLSTPLPSPYKIQQQEPVKTSHSQQPTLEDTEVPITSYAPTPGYENNSSGGGNDSKQSNKRSGLRTAQRQNSPDSMLYAREKANTGVDNPQQGATGTHTSNQGPQMDSTMINAIEKFITDLDQETCEKKLFDLFFPYKDIGILKRKDLVATNNSFKALLKDLHFQKTLGSNRYVHALHDCLDNLETGVAFNTAIMFNKCFLGCTYCNEEYEMTLQELLPRVIEKTYNQEFATELRKKCYETKLFDLFFPYQKGITTVKDLVRVLQSLKSYSIISKELPAIEPIKEYLKQLSEGHKPEDVPAFEGASYTKGDLTLNNLVNNMIKNTDCATLIDNVNSGRADQKNTIKNELPEGYVEHGVLSEEANAKKLLDYLDGKTDLYEGAVVADLKSKLGLLISGAWVNADFELKNGEDNWSYDAWYDCIVCTAKLSNWALDKQRTWFNKVLSGECKDTDIDPFELLSRKAIKCTEKQTSMYELIGDLDKLKNAKSDDAKLTAVVDELKAFFKNLLDGVLSEKEWPNEVKKIKEMSVSDSKKVSNYPNWVHMLNTVTSASWVGDMYNYVHPENGETRLDIMYGRGQSLILPKGGMSKNPVN